jgi:hypothetical protein
VFTYRAKIGVILLSLFLAVACPLLVQGQDETMTGKVVAMDSMSRKLTIRSSDIKTGRPDQTVFRVPKEAELTRGTRSMSFLDINLSDMVTITYYSDGLDGLKIRSLSNHNLGNR